MSQLPPIDFNGLDTAVHGPIRLGILTALQLDRELAFTELKRRLNTADGSLNLQLRKLEDAGYIRSEKSFVGLRPRSTFRITAAGRKALASYLDAMRQLIDTIDKQSK